MVFRHGFGQQEGADTASARCRYGFLEEHPNMSTISRARSFYEDGDPQPVGGRFKCANVSLPRTLVEIDGQEPTRFILEEGVYAQDVAALKVVQENPLVQWRECLVGA